MAAVLFVEVVYSNWINVGHHVSRRSGKLSFYGRIWNLTYLKTHFVLHQNWDISQIQKKKRGFKYCVPKTSINRGAWGTLSDLCHQSFRQSGPCCSSLLLYQIPWPSRTQLWPAGKLRSVNQDSAFIHFSKSSALQIFGLDFLLFNQTWPAIILWQHGFSSFQGSDTKFGILLLFKNLQLY